MITYDATDYVACKRERVYCLWYCVAVLTVACTAFLDDGDFVFDKAVKIVSKAVNLVVSGRNLGFQVTKGSWVLRGVVSSQNHYRLGA